MRLPSGPPSGVTLNLSRPCWARGEKGGSGEGVNDDARLTGHSHHVVGLGGTGSAQHHQFLLAADVTVHHGAHGPAVP